MSGCDIATSQVPVISGCFTVALQVPPWISPACRFKSATKLLKPKGTTKATKVIQLWRLTPPVLLNMGKFTTIYSNAFYGKLFPPYLDQAPDVDPTEATAINGHRVRSATARAVASALHEGQTGGGSSPSREIRSSLAQTGWHRSIG